MRVVRTVARPMLASVFIVSGLDVLANPELQKKFVGYGCVATPSTPQEFAALIGAEVPKWKSVVETQKITTQ